MRPAMPFVLDVRRNPVPCVAVGLLMAFAVATSWSQETTGSVKLIEGTGPGWVELGEKDFKNVNFAEDTWTWKDGVAHCTGKPTESFAPRSSTRISSSSSSGGTSTTAATAACSYGPFPNRWKGSSQVVLPARDRRLDGVAGRAGAVAGDRRGAQVVDDRVGDAVADERHRLLRRRRPRRRSARACAGTTASSLRLIEGAATCSPRRPLSAPRRSACARPLNASQPANSSRTATASAERTTGYSPGVERDAVLARRVARRRAAVSAVGVELGHRARGVRPRSRCGRPRRGRRPS